MSNQEEQQMAENKPRIMTGYIHYGESDDLTKLFDILNEFRKNNGLKYSHQSKAQMVFFNVSSEHLDAFSKVRPFKISRFQTRTDYKCDEATSSQLMGQKDSFLRMMWDEETKTITFQSRTPSRVHGNLVRRIFRDSGLEFQRDSYSVLRNFSSRDNGEDDGEDDGEGEENRDTQARHEPTPDGFQRVENKSRRPRNTATTFNSTTGYKVVKETENKPRVRGARATIRTPKTNV